MSGCLLLALPSMGQIDIKIKKKADKEANGAVDEGVNEVKGLFGKKDKKKKKDEKTSEQTESSKVKKQDQEEAAGSAVDEEEEKGVLTWSKYDFVPGTNVIFEDDLTAEENGEFPSRWDIKRGNVENAILDGEKVIMFRSTSEIIPWLDDPENDYLPDVFTLEFDCYFSADRNYETYSIYFYDRKNQEYVSGMDYATIYWNRVLLGDFSSYYPGISNSAFCKEEGWRHISVAFNKRSMKIYLDDTRLVNVPNFGSNPTGITIYGTNDRDKYSYIKNIRIAEGGIKLYEKFQQDGKIVATGIRFETGKWTLKPESMGIINKVYDMLEEHPDINLSIEGHTDNVGDADFNMELSEKRADAVMNTLTSMGIDKNRLSAKGYGETVAIGDNSSPEGRANNRRVEFVKN